MCQNKKKTKLFDNILIIHIKLFKIDRPASNDAGL